MAMVDNGGTLRLLIISKSPYLKHYCYLGLDVISGTIYRPVPSFGPEENKFFWPSNFFSFEIGETHEFHVVPRQDPISPIPLPHRNNDVPVKHIRRIVENGVVNRLDMFGVLQKLSRNSIAQALGVNGTILTSNNGRPYVEEGEDCQSYGVYSCTSEEASWLSFHKQEHILPEDPNENVLVIIETGRPLFGQNGFNPRRCYLVEAGVVSGWYPPFFI